MRPQNFWTLVVLNVITDACILTLPVPILWHLRVSRRRKLAVTLLLCSGLFLISTAIVRAGFTISSSPSVITINIWGFRETAAGVAAVNAPILAPLFSKAFWRRGPYRPGRYADELEAQGRQQVFGLVSENRPQPTVFEIPSALAWSKSLGSTTGQASRVTEGTDMDLGNLNPQGKGTGRGVQETLHENATDAREAEEPPSQSEHKEAGPALTVASEGGISLCH